MNWGQWVEMTRYGLGVLFVISLPPALLWWVVVHPMVRFWRRLGPKLTFWILGLGYLLMMMALFPFRRVLIGHDLGFNLMLLIPAAPLMVLSGFVQARRKQHLTFPILAGVPEIREERDGLLTEGIYAHIRHPRYVEFTLGVIAWGCLVNYSGVWIMIAISIFLLLGPITLLEERELQARFGDRWTKYSRRVPRFLPKMSRS